MKIRVPAALAFGLLAVAAPIRAQVTVAPLTEPLGVSGPVTPVKSGRAVYIVKLRDAGAATYKGGVTGFAATKPGAGERLDSGSGAVETYVKHIEQTHDRLLATVGASGSKVYSFRYTLNGFAARLSAAQVSRLAQLGEVERIWLDSEQQVQTIASAAFLGLEDQVGGLRADLKLRGENVVIGVIDSGVAPNHPSLADVIQHVPRACESDWARSSWLGLWLCDSHRNNPVTERVYEPPNGFRGICQEGEGFEASACNNKLIGARYYVDGFLFTSQLDEDEFRSPRDADGHGTHIATTVAGNAVSARLFGTRVGRIAGIAPRARVAVYKACWLKPGEVRATCATSDLVRAIDDAVADGVGIINYSIGSMETDLTAPDDLALLNALDAGVLSVVAAGNDGPNLDTIGSPSSAPWVLTVAASTQTGNLFEDAIEITAPEDLAEKIPALEANFTPQLIDGPPIEGSLVLVDDDRQALDDGSPGTTRDACQTLANQDELDGRIALIEEGGCIFEDKLIRAEQAGAIAAIVYARDGEPLVVMTGEAGSVDIPAVMIETPDGQRLADRISADGDDVQLTLEKGVFVERRQEGNQMADFSSRGPPLSDQNFLKPDVTAPGVNILAGHTPDVANGLRGETFQYQSGTSQSAPEVAGIAALLKEAHPEWSPAALKSALMTTAYQGVYTSDGALANPFDMGAGHIDPNLAVDPGLVYESDFRDHAAYLCGYFEPPFPSSECDALATAGFSSDARNLNLPSIAVSDLITGDVIKRRVTNVGPPATFTAEVMPPLDVDVIVEPPTLTLSTGQTAEFTVRFLDRGSPLDLWDFGELRWFDGTHAVASPIAVQPVTLRAPQELMLSGTRGNASVPIAFGYGGEYLAIVNGLWPPFVNDAGRVPRGFVDDDPTNTFTARTDNGVTGHRLDVADGQLYLRVALFDEFTDGEDDLDLFLFYCPISIDDCMQIAESGGFTSDEEINVLFPDPGTYVALVHGFETDQAAGGPGANYSLFTWSFGENDAAGNLSVVAPATVAPGDRRELAVTWNGLAPGLRHLGAIAHTTPSGLYSLTIVNVDSP